MQEFWGPWFHPKDPPGSSLAPPGSAWFWHQNVSADCGKDVGILVFAPMGGPGSGATDNPFYNFKRVSKGLSWAHHGAGFFQNVDMELF